MMRAAAFTCCLALPVFAAGMCSFALAQTASSPARTSLPATSATGFATPAQAAAQGTTANGHQAEVRYSNGLLTVTARDASLNSILRQISQETGLTISGGVRDDRVFGTYGPDQTSAVLTMLLDGSGSNVLLINNAANEPARLILSPRAGGPTPPNEFAASRQPDQDANDVPGPPARFGAQGVPPQAPVGGPPNVQPNVQPAVNLTPSIAAPSANNSDSQTIVFPPVSATTTPATATTSSDVTQQTPNGVKTPQQIFEQLQRLRQQQEQAQPQDSAPQ